jgi:hypothetical protein
MFCSCYIHSTNQQGFLENAQFGDSHHTRFLTMMARPLFASCFPLESCPARRRALIQIKRDSDNVPRLLSYAGLPAGVPHIASAMCSAWHTKTVSIDTCSAELSPYYRRWCCTEQIVRADSSRSPRQNCLTVPINCLIVPINWLCQNVLTQRGRRGSQSGSNSCLRTVSRQAKGEGHCLKHQPAFRLEYGRAPTTEISPPNDGHFTA